MKQYMQDRILAAVGLLLVGLGYKLADAYADESALIPKLSLIAIGLLLILLAVDSVLAKRKLESSKQLPAVTAVMEWGPFLLVTVALGLFALAIPYLGFYFSSMLFLLIVGFGWGGVKKQTVILFTACFLMAMFAFFTLLFNVPLPTGIAR